MSETTRIKLTVIQRWELNAHCKRHRLSNLWFIDAAKSSLMRYHGYKYTVWIPGGDISGGAAFLCGDKTLKGALAQAETAWQNAKVVTREQPCSR